jgi:hypothetical protein
LAGGTLTFAKETLSATSTAFSKIVCLSASKAHPRGGLDSLSIPEHGESSGERLFSDDLKPGSREQSRK